jgi:predicted ATPase
MYGQWDFMPSTSRTAFQAMGLEREDQQNDLSPEQTIELQFMIQKMFIQQCKVHAQQNMVFDRSPLDHAAYAMLNCASFMRDTDLNHLYDYLKTTLPLFGFIFYFPRVELFGSVLDDGMRSQSEARRACHDWLLQGIARERNVELVRMPSGSVADRVAFMLMVMKSHREIWSSPIG